MPLSDKDFFWLVGIFEGEGSFGTNGSGRSPLLRLGMSDLDTVQRVAALMPGGYWHEKKVKDGYKPMWYYHLSGHSAYNYMRAFKHHMSCRRQSQIRKILSEWNSCHKDRKPERTAAALEAVGGR